MILRTLAILAVSASLASAQTANLGPVPRLLVKRTANAPQIDGKLDDAAWKNAESVVFLFPWDQQTGAKQKTTARLLWDENHLYVGYECEDADITAQFDQRDDPTYRDDAVEIFINPNPKQLDFYYGLEMNARAVLYDYFMIFGKMLMKRMNFDGVKLMTNINGTLNARNDKDTGWTLELAIPWSNFQELTRTLPPAPNSVWTANLNRWDGVEPARRLSQWSNSGMEKPNPHQPARFGELVFVP
jgi:hypothetical protein